MSRFRVKPCADPMCKRNRLADFKFCGFHLRCVRSDLSRSGYLEPHRPRGEHPSVIARDDRDPNPGRDNTVRLIEEHDEPLNREFA